MPVSPDALTITDIYGDPLVIGTRVAYGPLGGHVRGMAVVESFEYRRSQSMAPVLCANIRDTRTGETSCWNVKHLTLGSAPQWPSSEAGKDAALALSGRGPSGG